MRLKNKLAVITAAASGMGRAGVELFAREGATVAAVDINAAALKTVASDANAKGGKVIPIVSDLSTVDGVRQSVADAATALGGIDVMWAHAGTPGPATVEGLDPAEYEKAMAHQRHLGSVRRRGGRAAYAPARRRLARLHRLGVGHGRLDVQPGLFGRQIRRGRFDQVVGAALCG
jgi:NAD(P)-dependent dehydrogenase (short-subunit alcohol dehydrogenase family)